MIEYRPRIYLHILFFCLLTLFSCQFSFAKSIPDSIPGTTDKQVRYFRPASIILPTTFLVYGWMKPVIPAIENLDNRIMENIKTNHPDFNTRIDDYLQWAPSVSIYAMDVLKVKTKHRFIEHLAIDAGSIIITGGAGFIMRKISGKMEVYNSTGSQFPSGHTANAFRGAEIVFQELKDSHRILSYSGYLVASAVGVLRIYNKAHYLTEVLAGAGLGILSTKLTYVIFESVKKNTADKKRRNK